MINPPKIKLITIKPKPEVIRGPPDYSIDLTKQNKFMDYLDYCQCEIDGEELPYNVQPQIKADGHVNYQYWTLSFRGEGNFEGKQISGVIKFPKDFPQNAPIFELNRLPNGELLQHASTYGNIFCINLFTFWKSSTSVIEILDAIVSRFHDPIFPETYPNMAFAILTKAEQDAIQKAQAQLLPDFEKQ